MLEEEESYERNAPSIATTRACGNSQLASKLGSANRDYRVEMGTSSRKMILNPSSIQGSIYRKVGSAYENHRIETKRSSMEIIVCPSSSQAI